MGDSYERASACGNVRLATGNNGFEISPTDRYASFPRRAAAAAAYPAAISFVSGPVKALVRWRSNCWGGGRGVCVSTRYIYW